MCALDSMVFVSDSNIWLNLYNKYSFLVMFVTLKLVSQFTHVADADSTKTQIISQVVDSGPLAGCHQAVLYRLIAII